uniref:Phosphatidylinositol-specific phospholipase n=1 Tax=Colletotrichum fructicola (strain Nara gc5) TaxID=1213859 RepID=L2FEA4_COLFN
MRFHCMPLLYVISFFLLASALFSVLLSLAPCFVKSKNHCYRGYESHHSFDVDKALHAEWMKSIPDDANLTSLSIPGTHDTMTYSLRNQVFQATGYSYTNVLLTLFDFLEAHPSETVVMRLKEEGRPLGNNTMTFEDAFNIYLHNDTLTSAGAQAHFHKHNPRKPFPALGALRSKIFLLQNFPSKGPKSPYGVIWESSDMVLEDLWIIPSMEHLYMKWEAIENALKRAATSKPNNRVLYLAHLSASTAGGADAGKTGIVIMDFPGRALVDEVLARNTALADRSAEL